MNRLLALACSATLLCSLTAEAQLRITTRERLPLPATNLWSNPQFSPDGRSVFYTSSGFAGIWEYNLSSGETRQITDDTGAGYGFVIAPDGQRLVYRRTTYPGGSPTRWQDIVEVNLRTGATSVVDGAPTISTPVFVATDVTYTINDELRATSAALQTGTTAVLGIERTKIVLMKDGAKTLFDPLGNGSYIWPSLSPDGTRLLAFDMARGAFVHNIEDGRTVMIGRRSAPVWTRDGRWIVFMMDKDDGHELISSDLYCIAPDGTGITRLTDTAAELEMYPHCSPTDNKIVCSTPAGEIVVLGYGEVMR
jgi:Tol biopolymer transport system component